MILVAWVLLAYGIGLALRWHSLNHASRSALHVQWRRWGLRTHNSDAAPVGILGTLALQPDEICVNLAILNADRDGRIHWAKNLRASPVRAHRQPVFASATNASFISALVVVLVTADAGEHEFNQHFSNTTPRANTRSDIAPISAVSCARVTSTVSMIRSSQTLQDFDVKILIIGRHDKAIDKLQAQRDVCPGIKLFSADGLAAADAQGGHAREIGNSPAGSRYFVLFLEQDRAFDLHATTLEKMVLAARGRHVNMVSVQPTGSATNASPNIVCVVSPHHEHARATCHVRGAPILLRVPVWLSPAKLEVWANAAVAHIVDTSAHGKPMTSDHRYNDTIIASDSLASLFRAASEAFTVHSLRENDLLVSNGNSRTYRNNGSAPEPCKPLPCKVGHTIVDDVPRIDGASAASGRVNGATGSIFRSDQSARQSSRSHMPGFLLIVPWLEHGGADQFNVNLGRALTRLNIRVVVVTTLSSAHPTARDFYAITPDVFHLSHLIGSPRDIPGVLDVLTHLVVSRNVQVVMISHSALGYKLASHLRKALTAMRLGHVRFADFVHLEETEWGDGGYAAMSVKHAQHLDHTFAASQHVASWMRERGRRMARKLSRSVPQHANSGEHASRASRGVASYSLDDRISVAYIGVDTRDLRPLTMPERARVRSEMLQTLGKISTDVPIIAYIARMVDQKMPELFFEIVRQLREERQMEFVSLAIGGGPELAHLRANISHHPLLKRRVLTPGMLDHNSTIGALAAADVLLLPSKNEGVSLAVYEAMALGVTPVVSAVGGQCELVAHGAGVCVPLNTLAMATDPGGISLAAKPFVDELERLFSSREVLSARSRKARTRVERVFDIAYTLMALMRGICGNG